MDNLGVYIHIPFCTRKCNYCGFYSKPASSASIEAYVNNILSSIEHLDNWVPEKAMGRLSDRTVDSVFFGGGTPSLLSELQVEKILSALNRRFDFEDGIEVTMECNPTGATCMRIRGYKSAGVNRISLGCQSLNDDELKILGRTHSRKTVYDTIKCIRDSGIDNINLDFIFSIPGQTMNSWMDNLTQIAKLAPEHLSLYSLQLEEGTRFFQLFEAGDLDENSDDLDRHMYHIGLDFLKSEGYDHYEISNWSKEGHACRHNLKYWQLKDYLGLGATASSYVDGIRFTVDKSMKGLSEYRENSLFDNASELAFTSLRLESGIDFQYFKEKIGEDFWAIYDNLHKDLLDEVSAGNLLIDDKSIKLTRKGIDISNQIMAMLV